MTTLPTFQGAQAAQALAHAKNFIAKLNAPGFTPLLATEPLPVGVFHADAGHIWLRNVGKQFALSSDGAMLELIRIAEAGDGDAINILDEISDMFLNRSDTIPAFLRTYIAKQRKGYIKPRGGKVKADNILRDIAIMALLMDLVQHFGLRFTRNPSSRKSSQLRPPSACSVAAQALSDMGVISNDEAALNKVYSRWGPIILPGFRFDPKWAVRKLPSPTFG